ncbi:Ig-like domain-containing protein [Mobilitalea sibirica]|uniref:Ig-like domain-containing protein n=1 Tax=Mobilitalea sibirica TaxID=1462919 RepID=A0A8J7HA66_9FIRM|nr:Ig-like domain-containing protein [Mobilitalea sibirica]MBH1939656.1 Ig-like domain-containing protein [Mobilitalea sibirica]
MKKMRLFLSILLIISIATFSNTHLTNDKAQAAIYINDTTFTLEVGHYRTLRIHGTSSRARWHTSNSNVADITREGRVIAKSPGKATVTAYVAGTRIRNYVTVIKLSDTELTMKSGTTHPLSIIGTDSDITWKSSDESVVTVSDTGEITAKEPGAATIIATVDGKDLDSKVNVFDISQDSVVLEDDGILGIGHIKTLKVKGATSKVTWSSSDESVAVVTHNGRVYAKDDGTTTITASINGFKLTSEVRVLSMSPKWVSFFKGDTKKLQVYGTDSKVVWSSNNEKVATVSSDGTVTGKSPGTATIYGFVDGRKVRAKVWVLK